MKLTNTDAGPPPSLLACCSIMLPATDLNRGVCVVVFVTPAIAVQQKRRSFATFGQVHADSYCMRL